MGALDKKLRSQMQLELVEIIERVGVTCVMVTHDQEEAMTMAERIAIMHQGWIAQVGSPMDIYETPASRLVCEFIGNVNLFDGEIITDDSDHAVIICPKLERPIYIGHGITSLAENKRVTFALRPEKLLLCSGKPDDLEHEDYNWAKGIVHDIAYLGGHSVYHVELASGTIVQAFIANSERNVKRPTWDDEVYVHWVDDSGVVFQS
jgi:putrescine transport system ATP-binding protein